MSTIMTEDGTAFVGRSNLSPPVVRVHGTLGGGSLQLGVATSADDFSSLGTKALFEGDSPPLNEDNSSVVKIDDPGNYEIWAKLSGASSPNVTIQLVD